MNGRLALLAAIIALAGVDFLSAQGRWNDALLHPFTPRQQWIGGEFGYAHWMNDARFLVTDNNLACAEFTDGEGNGFLAGARAMIFPIRNNDWFMLMPRVRFEARSGTFITRLPSEPARGEGGERIMLEQEAQVDATISTASFELSIGSQLFGTGLYAYAGGSAGLLMGGYFDYTERLLAPSGFTYTSTGTNEQALVGGRDFENWATLTADLRGGAGYLHRLGNHLGVSIEGFYSYPVLSALDSPDELLQSGAGGSISILYNLGDDE